MSRVTIPKAAVVGRAHSTPGLCGSAVSTGVGRGGPPAALAEPSRRCCFWRNHMWHFEASEDRCVESWRL